MCASANTRSNVHLPVRRRRRKHFQEPFVKPSGVHNVQLEQACVYNEKEGRRKGGKELCEVRGWMALCFL